MIIIIIMIMIMIMIMIIIIIIIIYYYFFFSFRIFFLINLKFSSSMFLLILKHCTACKSYLITSEPQGMKSFLTQ